ncbi:hypothetical protein JQX13_18985 [Archangium violaceum]|uniref:hypothetical protein n=1 Tax=Archangium violaceum TaxID=83451 RepID=UPI00193BF4B9|nr:hypothetical protein [Archangium violaceum]QRK11953.1 hypothetical protein JQX13_18985 [Archangium violaceum]
MKEVMFRNNAVGSLRLMMLLAAAAVTACGPADPELAPSLASDSDALEQQLSGPTQSEVELIDTLRPSLRWRRVTEYSYANGFAAGFNNYHYADYGSGLLLGTILININSHAVEWRDVPLSELGNADIDDIPEMFKRATDYAYNHGFAGGLPTFHRGTNEQGEVRGVYFFRPGSVSWVDVPTNQLRNYSFSVANVREMMTAAHDYATARGYAGGLPTFHEATHDGVAYRGILLIPHSTAEWRDVYVTEFDKYWPEQCTPTQTYTCYRYCNGICMPGHLCLGNSHTTAGPLVKHCSDEAAEMPTPSTECESYFPTSPYLHCEDL